MKLQAQFTIYLFAATVVVLLLSLGLSFRHVEITAKDNAYKTCYKILAQIEASRNYVRDKLRPIISEHIKKGEFIPEAMSASFVARSQFEQFLKDYPDYYVKFASNNPRNPLNLANDTEKEVLAQFTANPEMKDWQGIVTQQDKRYFMVAKPFRFKAKCMRCHSDPAKAPASMVASYGDKMGFGAKIGDVSMYSIGVPIDVTYADIVKHSLIFFIPIFSLICLIMVSSFFLYRRLVTAPIAGLLDGVARFAGGNYQSRVDVDNAGELRELAESFNVMAKRLDTNISRREEVEADLRQSRDELELRVEERTAELQKNNEELRSQIEKRQDAESRVETLSGLLPLCSFCKKIRDDKGYWEQVDVYIHKYSDADISHSICPECAKEHYPEEYESISLEEKK